MAPLQGRPNVTNGVPTLYVGRETADKLHAQGGGGAGQARRDAQNPHLHAVRRGSSTGIGDGQIDDVVAILPAETPRLRRTGRMCQLSARCRTPMVRVPFKRTARLSRSPRAVFFEAADRRPQSHAGFSRAMGHFRGGVSEGRDSRASDPGLSHSGIAHVGCGTSDRASRKTIRKHPGVRGRTPRHSTGPASFQNTAQGLITCSPTLWCSKKLFASVSVVAHRQRDRRHGLSLDP